MASNRHLGRIISLQSLYEYEFRSQAGDVSADPDLIVAKNITPYEDTLGDTEFVYRLTRGVLDHLSELDAILGPLAPEWPIAAISAVDRNILRIGLFELKFWGEEVPPRVAINEAVELAKAFGAENSSRFINGVLGTAYRRFYPGTKSEHYDTDSKPSVTQPTQPDETDRAAAAKQSVES